MLRLRNVIGIGATLLIGTAAFTVWADPPANHGNGNHGAAADHGDHGDHDHGQSEHGDSDHGHANASSDGGTSAHGHADAAKERADLRAKVEGVLHGHPMSEAMKQELRRHARATARIERVIDLAQAANDTATVDRAKALLTKENDRHDKWMSHYDATTGESK